MRYIIEGKKKSAYFDNSKPWYLLGIVSFGTTTCSAGNPAIYIKGGVLHTLDSRHHKGSLLQKFKY